MFAGYATREGTLRFAARFPGAQETGFYRTAQGLRVSSVGLGTYLGEMDEATDRAYAGSARAALDLGLNFIDTSLNYRNQRSELALGAALRDAFLNGGVQRDEIAVCTKAGYLVPNAVPQDLLAPQDVVHGMHSIAPAFLGDQLGRSRRNLGLESIDVLYLHNPETQLAAIAADEFYARVRAAFTFMEAIVDEGGIRFYGVATWDGFRRPAGAPDRLALRRLAGIATEIAGDRHHFRFIQLPFNMAMPEAFLLNAEGSNLLIAAEELGINVVASASLLQARLATGLPAEIAAKLPGTATDAQRAIQFTRSTPGIAVALVGMSNAAHVQENLALSAIEPLAPTRYMDLYKK